MLPNVQKPLTGLSLSPCYCSDGVKFMIRYLYADQLDETPKLRDSMFRDRAWQFRQRLNWQVNVDARGFERDQYDDENPLYVIHQLADGSHGGSMRFLPTTGRTMVNDHFLDLTNGVAFKSPLIWECTRFCQSPRSDAAARVSARLMLAAAELGRQFSLDHAVGVFDARMVRVYRAMGWAPELLGQQGEGADAIGVGLWEFSRAPFHRLNARAGVRDGTAGRWLRQAFQSAGQVELIA